ncbi:MAG: hypothetical protein P1U74_07880 [Legionellaceae bacterium]|nr:hypothetical protein [Legionellaceae bacterium]
MFKNVLSVIVIIFIIGVLNYKYFLNRVKIKRWMKALSIPKHQAVFEEITESSDGFNLSKQARVDSDAPEYTYGEVVFTPFVALLSLAGPNSNTIFYDLGSGIGKAVFACSMVFNVNKSFGIELFPNLHTAAVSIQNKLAKITEYASIANTIKFINADFLKTDFSDATLIFINATGLFGETWHALNAKLDNLPRGVKIITTSKMLISDKFEILKETKVEMSWGVVTAYIQEKTLESWEEPSYS